MIEGMSVDELAALDEEVRIMAQKGYDEKVQRK
jgi:hypothetical protein